MNEPHEIVITPNIDWGRLRHNIRKTNRCPTEAEPLLSVARSWFIALVVCVAMGLVVAVVSLSFWQNGPVW